MIGPPRTRRRRLETLVLVAFIVLAAAVGFALAGLAVALLLVA